VPICVAGAFLFEPWSAIAQPTRAEGAALLHLGLVVTPVSFALWYAAIERLGVERASLFFGVLPISVLATAAVVGGAPITAVRVLGIALVTGGIVLGMRAGSARAQAELAAAPAPALRPNTVPPVRPEPPG
jgi:drug/metabolite transporter (DMT)-like permease